MTSPVDNASPKGMLPATFIVFLILFTVRYLRTLVHLIVFCRIKTAQIPEQPRYVGRDCTVILPTVLAHDIRPCLRSILANRPREVLLVVPTSKRAQVKSLVKTNSLAGVRTFDVAQANKRKQMVRALREVKSTVTVFADDDVYWPKDYLSYLMSAFEDDKVGAAGTNQRVIRDERPSIWNVLGIAYLERRNFNNFGANRIDGSVSTLSGRTSAYRTEILQNDAFYKAFQQDRFLGRVIRIGDDKMLTKWTFARGWKIRLVWSKAPLETTLDEGPKFLAQCLRWARSHWQGNLAVVLDPAECSYLWRKHPWGAYALYVGSLMTPALAVDALLWTMLHSSLVDLQVEQSTARWVLTLFAAFTLAQKTVKMWPHFLRHPSDLVFVPLLTAFSYFHGIINVTGLVTMRASSWGNKKT